MTKTVFIHWRAWLKIIITMSLSRQNRYISRFYIRLYFQIRPLILILIFQNRPRTIFRIWILIFGIRRKFYFWTGSGLFSLVVGVVRIFWWLSEQKLPTLGRFAIGIFCFYRGIRLLKLPTSSRDRILSRKLFQWRFALF